MTFSTRQVIRLVLKVTVPQFRLATQHSFAQRAGQSVTVRTGTVTAMKSVDLNDGNAIGGALVGGAFGAALYSKE